MILRQPLFLLPAAVQPDGAFPLGVKSRRKSGLERMEKCDETGKAAAKRETAGARGGGALMAKKLYEEASVQAIAAARKQRQKENYWAVC